MGLSNILIIKPERVYFFFLMLVSIHVLAEFSSTPAFFQVAINSISCVYIGCFLAAKIKKDGEGKAVRSDEVKDKETMTNKDAYMFPVYGSAVLFGIYTLYKYLPNTWLNNIFSIHFTLMGLLCLANLIELPLSRFAPEKWNKIEVINFKKTIDLKIYKKDIDIQINYTEAVCIAISLFPTILYIMTKGNTTNNWLYNNIFGLAFSIIGIEQLVLPSFKTGFILLWGLFFYDIFWVYGTDVMVSVAK